MGIVYPGLPQVVRRMRAPIIDRSREAVGAVWVVALGPGASKKPVF